MMQQKKRVETETADTKNKENENEEREAKPKKELDKKKLERSPRQAKIEDQKSKEVTFKDAVRFYNILFFL